MAAETPTTNSEQQNQNNTPAKGPLDFMKGFMGWVNKIMEGTRGAFASLSEALTGKAQASQERGKENLSDIEQVRKIIEKNKDNKGFFELSAKAWATFLADWIKT